ncbi:TonB-dependent siderophore receptor [Scytonema sp. NUACC26]|uniref:TonB-dependent siderophore receptor n=1 Tax=Scytonema sp. NUACC26 TaxID=3140176 RepID=UPI0034DC8DF6
MKPQRLNYFFWQSLLLTGSVVVLTIKPLRVVALPIIGAERSASKQQLLPQAIMTKSVAPIREIRSLNQIEHPLTDAQKLVQSPTRTGQAEIISVTGVKVYSTDKGLEVILETNVKSVDAQRLVDRHRLQVTPKTEGNSYLADIPNAQLRLTGGESFRQLKPIAGITEVTVTNIAPNSIRLTVTGEALTPVVELFDSPQEGLVFRITTTASTARQNTPEPTPPVTEQQQQSPIELDVTAPPDTGYQVPNASVGTKTDTPIRNIPQSIQVIPRQVLQDRGSFSILDAARTVGIQPVGRFGDIYLLRGFQSRNYLRNRLLDLRVINSVETPITNIDRIEVLRGPTSVLYGSGQPSGTINLITKQPLPEPYYAVELARGGYNFFRPAIDLSGPVTDDKSLLYRLNASYSRANSFTDFYKNENYFVSPIINWRIGKNTKLTFEAEYSEVQRRDPSSNGLPAVGTVLPNTNGTIPISRAIGEPSDFINRRTTRIGYNFEHNFSKDWSLNNSFRAWLLRYEQQSTFGQSLASNNRLLNRTTQLFPEGVDWDNYAVDTHVIGKFKTGSIGHQLLLGFDFNRDVLPFNLIRRSIAPLDLFNPVYNQPLGSITLRSNTETQVDVWGVYAQDRISLLDNFNLVLGGRFDNVDNEVNNKITSVVTSQDDSVFSPFVGIVYQPNTIVSLYANYTRSFEQNVGVAFDGSVFKPRFGTQYEVGIKTDWLNGKLSTNLSLYKITLANGLTPDPVNRGFSVQTGEQESRGVELITQGEILPGWNIIASYTYTNAEITSDNRFRSGNRLNSVPEHSASLWTTYTIPKGDLQGFGVGLGFIYVGERSGDLANTFTLPSYFRTDASLFYKNKGFNTVLGFNNLFNINYFESATDVLAVYPGSPFTATLSLGWQF